MKRYLIAILVGLVPASAEAVQWLKQSTAVTVKVGPFVDSSDASAETALAISQADIRLSKNGGAFAQTNNATGATHDENGYYGVPLDTTDTNTLGTLKIAVAESGTLAVWQDFMVVPDNVYDSLVGGSDYIQTDLTQVEGTAASTSLASANDVRDAVTGGSYALDTDANGRIRIVDGTGAGELDTNSGAVLLSVGTGTGQISLSSGGVSLANTNITTVVGSIWNAPIASYSATPNSVAEALAGIWTDTNAVDTQTEMRTFLTGADSPVLAEDNLPSNFSSLEINGSGAVDSMLQGFLDNTIAESTANNIATNFEVFFDNGDAVSTSVIDDVQSGGLDAAGVRAALGMASANMDIQLGAISGYVDDIGASGAGLSAVPWNATWDAEVQSEAADALTAYDPPTDTEMDAQFSAIDTKLGTPSTSIAGDIASISSGTGYAKDNVDSSRVWTFPKNWKSSKSPVTIIENASFNGTLKFDLTNRINEGAGALTITSVTCDPSDGITLGTPVKTSDNKGVMVSASGFESGVTYTFTVTHSTTDSDTALVSTGDFKAE